MKLNRNLLAAKQAKNDEFYTRIEDIENELVYYKEHFKGKVICCPCDETQKTNFYHHFRLNVEEYGWKKLICIGYEEFGRAMVRIITIDDNGNEIEEQHELLGNGDFRDKYTIELIEESDIIVTNPPFSLFREFIDLLISKDKKFLVIGNKNAVICKEIFPLIKDNKVWLGYTSPDKFIQPSENELKVMTGLTRWFTNLEIKKREIILDTDLCYERGVNKGMYKKFDNYNAINVGKVKDIPMDYEGVMGVPVTFLDKYNPKQFEILGITSSSRELAGEWLTTEKGSTRASLDGKYMYARLLIRKK